MIAGLRNVSSNLIGAKYILLSHRAYVIIPFLVVVKVLYGKSILLPGTLLLFVEKNKVKLESKIQSILSEVDKHIEQDKQERTPDNHMK